MAILVGVWPNYTAATKLATIINGLVIIADVFRKGHLLNKIRVHYLLNFLLGSSYQVNYHSFVSA